MAPLSSLASNVVPMIKRLSLPLSSAEAGNLLSIRDNAQSRPKPNYSPGNGGVSPTSISNNGIFALFGLIGAGLVITSIWFFFWAKNGSFRFRKGDWDDYKSTVLRRKGPNGTTLSGATKSTDLGGGSIVGSQGTMSEFADPEKAVAGGSKKTGGKGRNRKGETRGNQDASKKSGRAGNDNDMRAYRHERAARVGGLNREADGSYHDYTNTDMSSSLGGSQPVHTHKTNNKNKTHKPEGRSFSYGVGTEATFSVASDDSHRPLNRPTDNDNSHHHHNSSSPRHSRQPSPIKRAARASQQPPMRQYQKDSPARHHQSSEQRSMPGSFAEPLDFDSRYGGGSEVAASEQVRNTKAYIHPLPGLSGAGNGGAARGFRRGGGGRRDSLSDSEGETGTCRS